MFLQRLTIPLCFLSVALAQSGKPPEFDVATFKQSPPATGDSININLGTALDGKVTLTNVTLSECVMFAYAIPSDSLIFGPDWIKSRAVRYDVVAKAPPTTDSPQLLSMFQTLLADRVNLKGHWEKRPMQHLVLIVGKNGPKLKPAEGSGANPASFGHIARSQITMQLLATLLSRFERQVIVDGTGLAGTFAVTLDWSQDASGPSIFTAVQEQLGLKLDSRKGPVSVFVIDAANQMPKDNE